MKPLSPSKPPVDQLNLQQQSINISSSPLSNNSNSKISSDSLESFYFNISSFPKMSWQTLKVNKNKEAKKKLPFSPKVPVLDPIQFKNNKKNIAVVWDFDNTLTTEDTTSVAIKQLVGQEGVKEFWSAIKQVGKGSLQQNPNKLEKYDKLLSSDAPIWMYTLAKFANAKQIPLNRDFFFHFVAPQVKLFEGVKKFMAHIKSLENRDEFKAQGLKIHHFIVSAGLKDLIDCIFTSDEVAYTFGCKYSVLQNEDNRLENVPVFCMDEVMKTRSLFEISKGLFFQPKIHVNEKTKQEDFWCLFEDMIYVGDGPTDIPALALVRKSKGMGVIVTHPKDDEKTKLSKLQDMSLGLRADCVTKADFSSGSILEKFIENRAFQILQKYTAQASIKN